MMMLRRGDTLVLGLTTSKLARLFRYRALIEHLCLDGVRTLIIIYGESNEKMKAELRAAGYDLDQFEVHRRRPEPQERAVTGRQLYALRVPRGDWSRLSRSLRRLYERLARELTLSDAAGDLELEAAALSPRAFYAFTCIALAGIDLILAQHLTTPLVLVACYAAAVFCLVGGVAHLVAWWRESRR